MNRTSFPTSQFMVGCWVTTPNPWACEIAASIGYSAVIVDFEHGVIHGESADRLIALSLALGLATFVRVASPERVPIQQALDAGAHGVILPQVRDLEHAQLGASFTKYPTIGVRGMGTPRSLKYGETPDDFVATENRRTRCLIMIETPGALRDVEKIVALATVDGVFMGPYDLSLTRGRGQYRAGPEDDEDARRIARAVKQAGKFLGIPVGDGRSANAARAMGADLISTGDDLTALSSGLRRAFNAVSVQREA